MGNYYSGDCERFVLSSAASTIIQVALTNPAITIGSFLKRNYRCSGKWGGERPAENERARSLLSSSARSAVISLSSSMGRRHEAKTVSN